MKLRFVATTMAACLLVTPLPCAGQVSYEITFKVPLNLSQISTAISKVAVNCTITSTAITTNAKGQLVKQEEFAITNGQLVFNASVVILASGLVNPGGTSATYSCVLLGFSTLAQRWLSFSETATVAEFRTTTTPLPLEGNFTW